MSAIRKAETAIVGRFVDDALAAGYQISVSLERGYDIEDMLLASTDRKKIMEEAFAGDEAHLFIHEAGKPAIEAGRINSIGWVFIVLGNDGYDVICDYDTNLEQLLKGAETEAKEWE